MKSRTRKCNHISCCVDPGVSSYKRRASLPQVADSAPELGPVLKEGGNFGGTASQPANDDPEHMFDANMAVNMSESSASNSPDREPSPLSTGMDDMNKKMDLAKRAWDGLSMDSFVGAASPWDDSMRASSSRAGSRVGMNPDDRGDAKSTEDLEAAGSESHEAPNTAASKAEVTKPAESTNAFAKKSASVEQQNVCKVKPQQQAVKPQPVAAAEGSAEREPQTQATPHILAGGVPPAGYSFQMDGELMHMQHRQAPYLPPPPQQQQQQPGATQQQAQDQQRQQQQQQPPPQQQPAVATHLTHAPPQHLPANFVQVSQAQAVGANQEIAQSTLLPSGPYSTPAFQASQSFVSMLLPGSTATQAPYVATRTQATSIIGLPSHQPKPATGSVFAPSITPPTQTVYMPFDPQTIGTSALFGLSQQSQPLPRQLVGPQQRVLGDSMRQIGAFPPSQQQQQQLQHPFPSGFPFQKQQFELGHPAGKAVDQSTTSQAKSEMAKHVNAKPFEPPKRLSTPNSTPSSSPGVASLMGPSPLMPVNMMSVQPSPPNAANSPPISSSFVSTRTVSVSPANPTLPFTQAVGPFNKPTPLGQFHLQQQVVSAQQFTPFQQGQVQLPPTASALQAAQLRLRPQQPTLQSVGALPVTGTPVLPNPTLMAAAVPRHIIRAPGQAVGQPSIPMTQRFPGPIQRPVQSAALQHAQPRPAQPPRATRAVAPIRMQAAKLPPSKPGGFPVPGGVSAAENGFRSAQRQKMLESTRSFFEEQSRTAAGKALQPQEAVGQQKQQISPGQQQQLQQAQLQQQLLLHAQQVHQAQQQQQQQQQMNQGPLPQQQQQQREQQQQQQFLSEQRGKVAPQTGKRGPKPQTAGHKQDKKDGRSHIIELNINPRNKKQETPSNKSKSSKDPAKSEEDKKPAEGKATAAAAAASGGTKARGPVRIQPFPQARAPPSMTRAKPARGGGGGRYSKAPAAAAAAASKPKVEPAPQTEKLAAPSTQDTSPKNVDQLKPTEAVIASP